MGSWLKTCGLTNLPIIHGDDTYVFVLQRIKEIDSHCYATHLYRPLMLPFVSTYNDYGGGENSRGSAFGIIMEGIKQQLVEMPVGENQYHDIAVSREAWGEELFFDSVHEGRLHIQRGGEHELDFVMIRKDVVDDLIESYEFEEYVGDSKGTHGYHNSYVRYKMEDVIGDIDPFLDAMIRIREEMDWAYHRMDMLSARYQKELATKNRAAQWCRHDLGYRYCNVVEPRDTILELLFKGERVLARELMEEHLKAMFVDSFMESTRKSWIPGGHEGSQSQDQKPYRALIAAMNRVMDERDAEYAAEYGDEDEEE